MDLFDSYFTPEWTMDHFLDAVETLEEQNVPPEDKAIIGQKMPPAILKPTKRKTFGALINELKEEIRDLKLEIEIRDAYIFAMLNELTKNKK
jgi:hypothetical protein